MTFDPNRKLNKSQKVLTAIQFEKLVSNHKNTNQDHKPVVKFFGGASCTWLISELDPETGIAFGLCDLGMGSPELGYVSLYEIMAIRFPPFGLPAERDLYFEGEHPMSVYANKAKENGYIVCDLSE